MVKSSLAAAILLCVVLPLRASIQELEVKANYSGHDAAYSFGILQYRGYFDRLLAGNGHVYVDFDTEALYLQGGYNIGPISFPDSKATSQTGRIFNLLPMKTPAAV